MGQIANQGTRRLPHFVYAKGCGLSVLFCVKGGANLPDCDRRAFLARQGKRELLLPICGWFTEASTHSISMRQRLLNVIDVSATHRSSCAKALVRRTSSTLADLLTPLLVANPFLAIRATLLWWLGDKFEYGLPHGWQSWLRRWTVDSFFPVSLF